MVTGLPMETVWPGCIGGVLAGTLTGGTPDDRTDVDCGTIGATTMLVAPDPDPGGPIGVIRVVVVPPCVLVMGPPGV